VVPLYNISLIAAPLPLIASEPKGGAGEGGHDECVANVKIASPLNCIIEVVAP